MPRVTVCLLLPRLYLLITEASGLQARYNVLNYYGICTVEVSTECSLFFGISDILEGSGMSTVQPHVA